MDRECPASQLFANSTSKLRSLRGVEDAHDPVCGEIGATIDGEIVGPQDGHRAVEAEVVGHRAGPIGGNQVVGAAQRNRPCSQRVVTANTQYDSGVEDVANHARVVSVQQQITGACLGEIDTGVAGDVGVDDQVGRGRRIASEANAFRHGDRARAGTEVDVAIDYRGRSRPRSSRDAVGDGDVAVQNQHAGASCNLRSRDRRDFEAEVADGLDSAIEIQHARSFDGERTVHRVEEIATGNLLILAQQHGIDAKVVANDQVTSNGDRAVTLIQVQRTFVHVGQTDVGVGIAAAKFQLS